MRKASVSQDPELFKKLKDEIWEFRTLYNSKQYRFLAFWDKRDATDTLVVSTHGFIKKEKKIKKKQIDRALSIRRAYFEDN